MKTNSNKNESENPLFENITDDQIEKAILSYLEKRDLAHIEMISIDIITSEFKIKLPYANNSALGRVKNRTYLENFHNTRTVPIMNSLFERNILIQRGWSIWLTDFHF